MHVLFAHDTYYSRDKNGKTYAYGSFPYDLWAERFLPHFEKMTIIGREKLFDAEEVKSLDISSGAHVEHVLLRNINTPLQRLVSGQDIYFKIEDQVKKADAVIIRGPVEFGMMAAKAAREHGKPYAVEMSGCGFDNVWYHGSPVGKIYAPFKYLRVRHMVAGAEQVIYVTEKFLQARYPTKAHTDFASNVEIDAVPEEVLKARLAAIDAQSQKLTFGMIGNFNNRLKGLHVALEALSIVKDRFPHFELRLLGQASDTRWAGEITRFGLKDQVVFTGTLPGGAQVMDWLDEIDIYLQPSFHEGLPRGLIEAMSRGCPALASSAGGIPELLSAEFVHRKGDVEALAGQILKLTNDSDLRRRAAQDNFERAKDYTKDKLAPKRAAFWARFAEQVKNHR